MALDAETRDQLISSVRRFVDERLRPIEDKVSETDQVPEEIVGEMKELGLFGISVPVEYGGLGLTMEEECLLMFELGRTSPAFRSVIGTNVGIGSQGIVMHGRQDQKEYWLPKIASGEVIVSFALTEPEAGSDAASLKATAIRDGDHYIVNGTKRYITNANKAHAFTLMARTDPKTPGAKGVSAFVVPRDIPGIHIGKPEKKMGQQGAHICDVVFEDARIPAECLLGDEEGRGFVTAMQVLEDIAEPLFGHAEVDVLGPVPAPMERRGGRYRCQLLLRSHTRSVLQAQLAHIRHQLETRPAARQLRWSIDVDPQNLD